MECCWICWPLLPEKDYEDCRRRQSEGISKAKAEGKYRGPGLMQKHELIRTLRLVNGKIAAKQLPGWRF
jgi:DNA invertase Pin-like site-specific DNA recombinase